MDLVGLVVQPPHPPWALVVAVVWVHPQDQAGLLLDGRWLAAGRCIGGISLGSSLRASEGVSLPDMDMLVQDQDVSSC